MDKTTSNSDRIRARAQEVGFSGIGICPAVTPEGLHRFADWLSSGYAGEMRYLEDRRAAYSHPSSILSGVRSLIMLTMNYATKPPKPAAPGMGRVSRYAWGEADYHDLIHRRLKDLKRFVQSTIPGSAVRGVVDTAPLLEREFAQLAGLGWVGKHTLLLNRQEGSWFFLAALLTDQVLDYDAPTTDDYCGSCTACLDACPTNAFPQPYVLDATQCISYLTIELNSPVPSELRSGVGDWLFGCDVCQEVCPWNRFGAVSTETSFLPLADQDPVDLVRLFGHDEETFRAKYRRTPLWRAKRRGLLRNAAIVLGNQRVRSAVAVLCDAVGDPDRLVRGACAWALGQIGGEQAATAIRIQLSNEQDADVRSELLASLERIQESTERDE